MDPREMLANPTMEQTSNSNTQTLINGQGQQAGLKMQPEGVKTAQDVTEEDVDKMQRSLFLAVLINKTHQCQELFYRLQNKAHGRGQITEKDSRETHRITKNLRDLICLAQTMNVCVSKVNFRSGFYDV